MADVLAAPTDQDADAPAPRAALPVLEGGLTTTILTLGFLYWMAHKDIDFNPMGWYANYVIPIGAILVGLVAGSGYGVMSWLRGVKIRRGLLVTVVALQLLAYGAAEYIAYLDVMNQIRTDAEQAGERFTPPSFLTYFHHKTENFAWKKKNSSESGEPLGHAGYFFVGLAALGFVGGGLIAPLVTMNLPYCAGCQRYMKTKRLGLIPASVPYRKVKKNDTDGQAALEKENAAAAEAAEVQSNAMMQAATAGDAHAFRDTAVAAFKPRKEADKLPIRVYTELVHCPGCRRGWLRHAAVAGQGKEVKRTVVAQGEVGPEFTENVLATPVSA